MNTFNNQIVTALNCNPVHYNIYRKFSPMSQHRIISLIVEHFDGQAFTVPHLLCVCICGSLNATPAHKPPWPARQSETC